VAAAAAAEVPPNAFQGRWRRRCFVVVVVLTFPELFITQSRIQPTIPEDLSWQWCERCPLPIIVFDFCRELVRLLRPILSCVRPDAPRVNTWTRYTLTAHPSHIDELVLKDVRRR
jgi:hypothetical protein